MHQNPAQHIFSDISHLRNSLECNLNMGDHFVPQTVTTQMTSRSPEEEYTSTEYSSMGYQQPHPGSQFGDGLDRSLQGNNYTSMTGQPSCTSAQTGLMMSDASVLPTYMPGISSGEGPGVSQTSGGVAVGDGAHTCDRPSSMDDLIHMYGPPRAMPVSVSIPVAHSTNTNVSRLDVP